MPSNNRLLDFDLVAPHLESVTLGVRKHLERRNRRIAASLKGDGARPSSRTVTSRASGSSDRRSREERHVRGGLPLANQVPHMLE